MMSGPTKIATKIDQPFELSALIAPGFAVELQKAGMELLERKIRSMAEGVSEETFVLRANDEGTFYLSILYFRPEDRRKAVRERFSAPHFSHWSRNYKVCATA